MSEDTPIDPRDHPNAFGDATLVAKIEHKPYEFIKLYLGGRRGPTAIEMEVEDTTSTDVAFVHLDKPRLQALIAALTEAGRLQDARISGASE